jgi:hypothetical protein
MKLSAVRNLSVGASLFLVALGTTSQAQAAPVRNIVLVHGAWVTEGETEVANGKRFPSATKAIRKTADDFLYLDPALFPGDFAADLPQWSPGPDRDG